MSLIERLDYFREEGYDIHINGSRGPFDSEDKTDRPWYVRIFLGDTNGPHKPETISGEGWGWTIEEAFDRAIADSD